MFGRKKKKEENDEGLDFLTAVYVILFLIMIGITSAFLALVFKQPAGELFFLEAVGLSGWMCLSLRKDYKKREEEINEKRLRIQEDCDVWAGLETALKNGLAQIAVNRARSEQLQREIELALQQQNFLSAQLGEL